MYAAPPPEALPMYAAPPQEAQPMYAAPPPQPTQYAPPAYGAAPPPPEKGGKPGLLKILIPVAAGVILLVTFAILFFATDIFKSDSNNGDLNQPIPTITPDSGDQAGNASNGSNGTVTVEPTQEAAPADGDLEDDPAGVADDENPDDLPAEFTGRESDYAQMPGAYGKSRNRYGYTVSDARGVTYENFLKIELDMSLSDVEAILSDADADSYEYSNYESWTFDSGPTWIRVEITKGKVTGAQYRDDNRVCVDTSDISMDKFLRLKESMTIDEVKGILGENFYKSRISSTQRADAYRLIWFSEDGEIEILFNTADRVTAYAQYGLQLFPDTRMKYGVLTTQQLLDNFTKVEMDIDYAELERQMDNYIPLYYSTVNLNFRDNASYYKFQRDEGYSYITIGFRFEDGKLYDKEFTGIPAKFLPKTDAASAKLVKVGMTYSEVKEILGEGYMYSVTAVPRREVEEEYQWSLPGSDYSYVTIRFVDGIIPYESSIYIYDT